MLIETIHHVSVPVKNVDDLALSKTFYEDILGLKEIARPKFPFEGAWYQMGDRQLHLIVQSTSTWREGKGIDSRDIHFAVRVSSYHQTCEWLRSKGYHPDATDEYLKMKESPTGIAGFPQIYIMDPNRNMIELNAAQLDSECK